MRKLDYSLEEWGEAPVARMTSGSDEELYNEVIRNPLQVEWFDSFTYDEYEIAYCFKRSQCIWFMLYKGELITARVFRM